MKTKFTKKSDFLLTHFPLREHQLNVYYVITNDRIIALQYEENLNGYHRYF